MWYGVCAGKRSLFNKLCAKMNKSDEVIVWGIMFNIVSSVLSHFLFCDSCKQLVEMRQVPFICDEGQRDRVKGIVYPKMKCLPSFIQPYVCWNHFDFNSVYSSDKPIIKPKVYFGCLCSAMVPVTCSPIFVSAWMVRAEWCMCEWLERLKTKVH